MIASEIHLFCLWVYPRVGKAKQVSQWLIHHLAFCTQVSKSNPLNDYCHLHYATQLCTMMSGQRGQWIMADSESRSGIMRLFNQVQDKLGWRFCHFLTMVTRIERQNVAFCYSPVVVWATMAVIAVAWLQDRLLVFWVSDWCLVDACSVVHHWKEITLFVACNALYYDRAM